MTHQEPDAQTKAREACEALGLSLVAKFVPFSQSRFKGETSPSLNWKVTIQRDGRNILTADYMQEYEHAPSYKSSRGHTFAEWDAVEKECETGRKHQLRDGWDKAFSTSEKIDPPTVTDVMYSLLMNAGVLNHDSFESWASEHRLGLDSRKAEAAYKACLKIARKLHSVLSDENMSNLRDAFSDY